MIVGIDLGTTNSAIGIWRDNSVQLIPNSLGHVLTPSAVGLDDDGRILVGMAARDRQVTHPHLTATAFKRYMGSTRLKQFGKQEFRPEELSAFVLRSLKADAEAFLGETVREAVITVPAYFNDKQRKATRRAGELAGLKVERLLNEPTAAALAYGIHRLDSQSQFLVFDLGGGTFDVSILEIFEGVLEVRASTGDNQLGGEDFNEILIDHFFARNKNALRADGKRTFPALYEKMRDQAERARRLLTNEPAATMKVNWKDTEHELQISAEEFENLAEPLLKRLREPVLRALRDSGIPAGSLREVALVGGATRMPIVRKAVTRMFGRFPGQGPNPDEAIAVGAAIQAGLKARDAALREVVLTDVCPYSLGVEIAEGLPDGGLREGVFAPVIERNTVVPTSRMRTFYTVIDRQPVVVCAIYQGESRNVQDNIRLGEIRVPVPPKPRGEVSVECRFSYDINGLLEIDLRIPLTGETRQLTIYDQDGTLSPEELVARREALARLKVHPRDEDANRAALTRAARCYEQFLGDKREHIGRLIAQFEAVLERQDPRSAELAREQLLKVLDVMDGERFL